jgi:YegS/Rv2252/BmrU family lipid kinase
MADLLLVVNPRSAAGSTGRRWPAIERTLRSSLNCSFDIAFTERPNHATAIARERAPDYPRVIALGGDGTVNEVVNGLIADDRLLNPALAFGVIPRGTGADFVKTLGIPRDLEKAARRAASGAVHEVDVGKVRYRTPEGGEAIRYFINECSVGMGAAVCERVNRSSKRLGGRLTFLWGIILTVPGHRDQLVRLTLDGGPTDEIVVSNMWVANGAYSGGGIHMAPHARLDDGLLDVVNIGHMGFLERITQFPKLRSGAFVERPQVAYLNARRVEMEADAPAPIETEGEPIGTLPATFELIDERLKVVA